MNTKILGSRDAEAILVSKLPVFTGKSIFEILKLSHKGTLDASTNNFGFGRRI